MNPVMRTVRSVAALVVVSVLVAGCSGASASPTPAPSASPALASAPPSAAAVPTVSPTPAPTQRTIESPDPSFSNVEVTCVEYLVECSLHRTNDAGIEAPGWPIALEGTLVDSQWNDFTIGCGQRRAQLVRGGRDDLTFVGLVGPSGAEIHAYESWGLPARGWPQPFPAPDGDCHGFMLDPSGERLIAWGYEGVVPDMDLTADRTEFTILNLDGTTSPGWPRGSEGAASGPVWFEDGLAYVSGTGRVWAHDAAGEVRRGWGYQLDGAEAPISFGPRLAILQPVAEADDRVTVIGLDGRPETGYPVDLGAEVESLCLYGDTPCVGNVGPTMAPDGTVFVALSNGDREVEETSPAGGRIAAFGPTGAMVEGWPVQLPERTHATRIGWSSEGPIIAEVVVCAPSGCSETERRELLWYALDGRWLEDLTSALPSD